MFPAEGIAHRVGESTTMTHRQGKDARLTVGKDKSYANMEVGAARSQSYKQTSSAVLKCSGIDTSKLLMKLSDQRAASTGGLPSLEFAVLVDLPSATTKGFEAHLTVRVNKDERRWRGNNNSMAWNCQYDGKFELGKSTMETDSNGSKYVSLAYESQLRTADRQPNASQTPDARGHDSMIASG